jgi:quercetin dioxygenase-like cupin family protein/uncharacterized protein YndB with AHSA1/START domain
MIRSMTGAVLEMPTLGIRTETRLTGEQTGGELYEFDVLGHARGLITQTHVHTDQAERHEVLAGSMRLVVDGEEHLLRVGDAYEVPPGAPHRQLPGPDAEGHIRVQLRPAGRTHEFLVRLRDMDAGGGLNRWGFPKPVAGAQLLRDFEAEGHLARPPLPVQRRLARAILSTTSREYVFVDEWDVDAPRETVFELLADARTYPLWWRPVYIDVEADGEPALGKVTRQHFKGRLPYHLHTRTTTVRLEPGYVIAGDVDGDLRGHGEWTLADLPGGGTHVRFDWRVLADRRLLQVLTPVLRPALRANHNWAIARARDGLEPFARARAAQRAAVG